MAQQFREAFQRMSRNVGSRMPPGGGGAGKAAGNALGAAVAAGLLGLGAYNSIYTVQGGQRAVMFNRVVGMKERIYGEGINFNIPWFERPIIYDIRTRPVNLQTLTGSKDLQMVTIAIRVLHKPDPSHLVWIYQHLGLNYDERILPSIMNECAKAVVARYNANELLTKRAQVSADISNELQARAKVFNILLDDVAITHLSFSPEYARAVEAKQVGKYTYIPRLVYTKIPEYVISHVTTCSSTGRRKGQVHCTWSSTRKTDYYYQGKGRSRIRHAYW
jgi:prohibitin 2